MLCPWLLFPLSKDRPPHQRTLFSRQNRMSNDPRPSRRTDITSRWQSPAEFIHVCIFLFLLFICLRNSSTLIPQSVLQKNPHHHFTAGHTFLGSTGWWYLVTFAQNMRKNRGKIKSFKIIWYVAPQRGYFFIVDVQIFFNLEALAAFAKSAAPRQEAKALARQIFWEIFLRKDIQMLFKCFSSPIGHDETALAHVIYQMCLPCIVKQNINET